MSNEKSQFKFPCFFAPVSPSFFDPIAKISRTCFQRPREYWTVAALQNLWDRRQLIGWTALASDPAFNSEPEQTSTLFGYIILSLVAGESAADILSLAVKPEYRGRAIATRLLARAIRSLPKPASAVWLEVSTDNETARKLYQSQGFFWRRHRPHYYGFEQHAELYERRLFST